MHTKYLSENLNGRDHSKDLNVDHKSNMRMDLRGIGWEGVDWTHLAQDKKQWWALVNAVMNLGFHKRR
jgi:hypothetical protein